MRAYRTSLILKLSAVSRLLDSSIHLGQVLTEDTEQESQSDSECVQTILIMIAGQNNQAETDQPAYVAAMLQQFAETADAVAATTKKLEKAASAPRAGGGFGEGADSCASDEIESAATASATAVYRQNTARDVDKFAPSANRGMPQ